MMGSSFLSFLVTEESALLAMVIKCHRLLKDVVMKNIPERLHMKDVESIVGKSDFDYGILILGSIFPNFPEYFS